MTEPTPSPSLPVDERPASDADQLREAAGWLDTYDEMARVFFDLIERSAGSMSEDLRLKAKALIPVASGDAVQADLRRIADLLDGTTPAPPVPPTPAPEPDPRAEARTPTFRASVRDAGGGIVELVVDRGCLQYPPITAWVEVRSVCERMEPHDHDHSPAAAPSAPAEQPQPDVWERTAAEAGLAPGEIVAVVSDLPDPHNWRRQTPGGQWWPISPGDNSRYICRPAAPRPSSGTGGEG